MATPAAVGRGWRQSQPAPILEWAVKRRHQRDSAPDIHPLTAVRPAHDPRPLSSDRLRVHLPRAVSLITRSRWLIGTMASESDHIARRFALYGGCDGSTIPGEHARHGPEGTSARLATIYRLVRSQPPITMTAATPTRISAGSEAMWSTGRDSGHDLAGQVTRSDATAADPGALADDPTVLCHGVILTRRVRRSGRAALPSADSAAATGASPGDGCRYRARAGCSRGMR